MDRRGTHEARAAPVAAAQWLLTGSSSGDPKDDHGRAKDMHSHRQVNLDLGLRNPAAVRR
jgi:hypothetical protein